MPVLLLPSDESQLVRISSISPGVGSVDSSNPPQYTGLGSSGSIDLVISNRNLYTNTFDDWTAQNGAVLSVESNDVAVITPSTTNNPSGIKLKSSLDIVPHSNEEVCVLSLDLKADSSTTVSVSGPGGHYQTLVITSSWTNYTIAINESSSNIYSIMTSDNTNKVYARNIQYELGEVKTDYILNDYEIINLSINSTMYKLLDMTAYDKITLLQSKYGVLRSVASATVDKSLRWLVAPSANNADASEEIAHRYRVYGIPNGENIADSSVVADASIPNNLYNIISEDSSYNETEGVSWVIDNQSIGSLALYSESYKNLSLSEFLEALTPFNYYYKLNTPSFESFSKELQTKLNQIKAFKDSTALFIKNDYNAVIEAKVTNPAGSFKKVSIYYGTPTGFSPVV